VKLLEVFRDFKIYVRGGSYHSRYNAMYRVVPRKEPKKVTVEDLSRYVEELQMKHPDSNFYLRTVKVDGRTMYVITRKSYEKLPDGRRKRVYKRIPIYVDVENQKFYVPKTYIERKYKLACYVLMKVLGRLGVSTVEFDHML